jgi:peptidoglycan/xylan/chitin deacetylase (PgdA/CDA1 family)
VFGPGPVEIPVLLYHHVDPAAGGRRYTISADLFRDQMQILADGGYETVTISEVVGAIRFGAELPARPIVLTFDDGNEDTYAEAFPILSSYGFRGVVFAVGNRTGAKGFMTGDELLALVVAGWEIGSHGWGHVDLTTLGATQWRQEILGSKLELERVLGSPVTSFAYPFGSATAAIIAKVAEYGYASGAGLGSANHHDRGSVYYLGRREIYGYWSLEQFWAVLESGEQ